MLYLSVFGFFSTLISVLSVFCHVPQLEQIVHAETLTFHLPAVSLPSSQNLTAVIE